MGRDLRGDRVRPHSFDIAQPVPSVPIGRIGRSDCALAQASPMIGIPLGLAAANATEWVVHKYVLHGLGKDRRSFWAFHWHEHHKNARRNGHHDPDYRRSVFGVHAKGKEAGALALAALAAAPFARRAPFFVGTLFYCGLNYYFKHKRAHLDPDWARAHLPWHYDHHMGPNQNANWCVTRPWFDHVMGTREPYVGTERELKDRARRARKSTNAESATDTVSTSPPQAPETASSPRFASSDQDAEAVTSLGA